MGASVFANGTDMVLWNPENGGSEIAVYSLVITPACLLPSPPLLSASALHLAAIYILAPSSRASATPLRTRFPFRCGTAISVSFQYKFQAQDAADYFH